MGKLVGGSELRQEKYPNCLIIINYSIIFVKNLHMSEKSCNFAAVKSCKVHFGLYLIKKYMDMRIQNMNVFQRMLDDKRAIRECIASKGDLKQLAHERNIKFATPV